jgi:hypothetical protein
MVFRFGGRPGALFTADIREDYLNWRHLQLPSTIHHLKSLDGGNQVLAAGLQNQLGIYDLRFARSRRGARDERDEAKVNTQDEDSHRHGSRSRNRTNRGKRNGGRIGARGGIHSPNEILAQPVVKLDGYRNAAHIDIGFAYDATTGVVAAAHDDVPGTVALYSVRTGSQLRVLDFAVEGRPRSHYNQRLSRQPRPILDSERLDLPVIQGLQFQTFPGDQTPTLFVGGDRKGCITAFSFGVEDSDDEA